MNKKQEKFLLIATDFITINFAWVIYFFIRNESGMFAQFTEPGFIIPMLVIFFYWFLLFIFFGMYRTWFALSRFDEIFTLVKTTFWGTFILFFAIFIDDSGTGESKGNRFLIFIYWGLMVSFTVVGRLLLRSIQRKLIISGIGRKKALIVGYNDRARDIHDQIISHPALGLDVIAYVAIKDENLGKQYNDIEVVGKVSEIEEIIDRLEIKEVILSVSRQNDDLLIEIISRCETKDVRLKIIPDLYEILSGQARTVQLYGFPLIDINPQLMTDWERAAKRIIDIVVSFLMLLASIPVTIATAIAIKFESDGPVIYKQERSGLNGKVFKVYKFRSMYQDAEKRTGPVWSQKDDPRITKVGRFIRRVRIDELPQIWNVFKGEMSLVGPRPERPFFVEQLAKEIPYYKRRLRVRPGITGWAQVKHKYDESVEDVKTKLQFDLFYIENMSLKTDIKILFRTVFVVLFGKGHYD
ncbi:MAG: sugar transferase [Ignavibacteriales bacterium]|nr:sugar transferase [Ignavibacteriales bacterium]